MKRISIKKKILRDRLSRKCITIRTKWNKRKKSNLRLKKKSIQLTPKRKIQNSFYTWVAPIIFNIGDKKEREILLKKIKDLKQAFQGNYTAIHFDFSQTEKMFAGATLLFLAELIRLKTISEESGKYFKYSCKKIMSNKIGQVLTQIKMFELLNIKRSITPEDNDVVHWKFAQGKEADGAKYDSILNNYDGELVEELKHGLYKGITEAMTNVINHAYPSSSQKNWWMFSQFKDGKITLVLCDLGVGIPKTLPKTNEALYAKIKKLARRKHDAACIERSIKTRATQTEQSNRGRGLNDIVSAVETIDDSIVSVYSNKGLFEKSKNSSKTVEFSNSIGGTLICWQFPFEKNR